MKMFIIGLILWLVIGSSGFIYWWTNDWDFTNRDVPMAVAASILGPFSYVAGYFIHSDTTKESKPIIRKRNENSVHE